MEEIQNFIEHYLETEHKARISYLSERSLEVHNENVKNFEQYYKKGACSIGFDRNEKKHTDDWFNKCKRTLEKKANKRYLFQIKEYDYEKYGKIYRCYVSDPSYKDKEYYDCIFAAKINGTFKIISVYYIKFGLETVTISSLKDWNEGSGEKIEKLGKPTNVLKLMAPEDNPAHLSEYNRE